MVTVPNPKEDRLVFEKIITIQPDRQEYDLETLKKIKCPESTHSVKLYEIVKGDQKGKRYYVFDQDDDMGLFIINYNGPEYDKLKTYIPLSDDIEIFGVSKTGYFKVPEWYRNIYPQNRRNIH